MEWINPHSWIHLVVPQEDGTVQSWMIEAGPAGVLVRRGWSRDSIAPGTEVLVEGYQARDGSNRANGRDVTLPRREPPVRRIPGPRRRTRGPRSRGMTSEGSGIRDSRPVEWLLCAGCTPMRVTVSGPLLVSREAKMPCASMVRLVLGG